MARRDKWGWSKTDDSRLVSIVEIAGYLVTGVVSQGRTQLGLAFCSPGDRAKGLFTPAEGIQRARDRIDAGEGFFVPADNATLRQRVAACVLAYPHTHSIPEYIRHKVHAGAETMMRKMPPRPEHWPEVATLTVNVLLDPGERGVVKKQLKAAMRLILAEHTPEAMARKFKAMLAAINDPKAADAPAPGAPAMAEPGPSAVELPPAPNVAGSDEDIQF